MKQLTNKEFVKNLKSFEGKKFYLKNISNSLRRTVIFEIVNVVGDTFDYYKDGLKEFTRTSQRGVNLDDTLFKNTYFSDRFELYEIDDDELNKLLILEKL